MAILNLENVTNTPIGDGDAGIIFKEDGSFRVFNTSKNPLNPTPAQVEQTRKILAFAAALQIPALMDVLYDFVDDPDISDIIDFGPKH